MTAAIRPVSPGDATAIAALYAPYVVNSVVSFEAVPPDAAEMRRRITEATATHPWLVAEADGTIAGYAYARPFNDRAAYWRTCETSIYLAPHACGRGVGRRLYDALLERLAADGHASAIALVTVPNARSEAFHAAMGFVEVGRLRGVGWKHGA